MLPTFLIVGAPKAGTTSLYHYLSEHSQVFMSNPKEVNFFSREEIEAQGLYYKDFQANNFEDYEKLFEDSKGEQAIGEASVSYLFYPNVPLKIKRLIPKCKIIIVLRDPVERAFSHYLMDKRLGFVNLDFDEIVYKKKKHKFLDLYYQQYIELGLYFEQVLRYLTVFAENQVKIFLFDDIKNDLNKVIIDLCKFLGINFNFKFDLTKKYNTFSMPKNKLVLLFYSSTYIRKIFNAIIPVVIKDKITNAFFEKNKKPEINLQTKIKLKNIYKPDIQKLENLIKKNLSNWYAN